MSMYSGSSFRGDGIEYSKLDLSGLENETKAFVKISVRAKNPIAHIEPPVDDGLTIIQLQFSGGTGGFQGQYLIWSFAGASHADLSGGINNATSTIADTGTVDNTGQFRAVSGSTAGANFQDGGRRGGIYFLDEINDRFRGIVSRKNVGIGIQSTSKPQGNNTNNSGVLRSYEMLHQVEKNAVYTFLCKEGAWFLIDLSNSSTGSTHSRIMRPNPFATLVSSMKAHKILFGKEDKTGDNSVSGSSISAQYDLNRGGSLANVDTGTATRIYEMIDGDDWGTGRTTSVATRDGMMYLDFTRRSQITAPFNYTRYYDVFRYNNSEDGVFSSLSIRQSTSNDEHMFQWGTGNTAGTMDKIKIHPQSGSIAASGGATSHMMIPFSRAGEMTVAGSGDTNVTINTITAGIANGRGVRMIRDGCVTGISLQMDAFDPSSTVPPPNVNVSVRVYKRDSGGTVTTLVTGASKLSIQGVIDVGAHSAYPGGLYNFDAGDTITVELRSSNSQAPTLKFEHIAIFVEIQTNPTFGEPVV